MLYYRVIIPCYNSNTKFGNYPVIPEFFKLTKARQKLKIAKVLNIGCKHKKPLINKKSISDF